MKAYVITMRGHAYSEACADRCIASAAKYGITVEKFGAVYGETAVRTMMQAHGLQWTWPNVEPDTCPYTGLKRHVYKTANPYARMGCSLSHFELWQLSDRTGEPLMILEHDAVFINSMPKLLNTEAGAIMLNNPDGATPKGRWWRQMMEGEEPGVQAKTVVFTDGRPDGLAGNSAYIISPRASRTCINAFEQYGVWPNDATLCRQLVPGLFQVYPFVTEVRQTQSTTGGY